MEKLFVGLVVVLAGMLLAMPAVYAYPVTQGDYIELNFGFGNQYGGGAVSVSLDNNSDGVGPVLFYTFCVERNEHIHLQTPYVITSITDGANSGGVSGGVNGIDPLDTKTAYLYSQWASGAITHTADNANALQLAIWNIEGELSGAGVVDLQSAYNGNTYAVAFFNEANNNATNGSLYGVQVMNLGINSGNQDLLVTGVPEPSTLLFLGSGLVGLGFAIRRRKI